MRKILFIGFVIVVLLLDFAALDDITTGSEPSFFGEYLMLIGSLPFLVIAFFIYRKKSKHLD